MGYNVSFFWAGDSSSGGNSFIRSPPVTVTGSDLRNVTGSARNVKFGALGQQEGQIKMGLYTEIRQDFGKKLKLSNLLAPLCLCPEHHGHTPKAPQPVSPLAFGFK